MQKGLEPKELRVALLRQMRRSYFFYLVGTFVLSIGLYFVVYLDPKPFSFFIFAVSVILAAFVAGGFVPLGKMITLERQIQAIKPREIERA